MSRYNSKQEQTGKSRHLSMTHATLLFILIIGAVWVIISNKNAPYRVVHGRTFGTTFTVKYKSGVELEQEIAQCLQKVDECLSMFNPSSVVSKINRGEKVETNPMFNEVFLLAQQVSEQTDGYFDVTIAPLVNLWGFGTENRKYVTKEKIDSIAEFLGYKKVSLENNIIKKHADGIQMDFSAIAKGYACDYIARMLKHHGVENYMIEIGGEIACGGRGESTPDGEEGWLIGISSPQDDSLSQSQTIATKIMLHNKCVATSGNYHRFYYLNGRKVSHTINPHTLAPVTHSLLSATVIAPTTAEADAYATAFMAAGLDSAKIILQNNKQLQAYLIYDNGRTTNTYSTVSGAR